MIRAVIVDDEPPARVRMRQLLEAAGDVTVVGEAGSAIEARAVIRYTHPDLLFLDVEMPEMRGTALAASLPEPRPYIVFATAFESYALEAIGVDATDYLLKPVSRSKLAATLERVRARLNRQTHLEREVKVASALQAQMWPGALPSIAGFDCAAASLPARGVGGDFYDAFEIGESRWGLLLGDVSGKGMAAGLVAAAVQARVHTAARLARLGPESLMAAVDRDVFETTGGARYATAVYATLDTAARSLVLVNAGHPAALVLDPATGGVTRISSTGPALGLLQDGEFTSSSLTLTPGTVLVAYTDGVNEALDDNDDEFGERRLVSLLLESHHLPAAGLCARILDAVRHHRGARQDQDDVTALVVKTK
jgi:phosphoserine phosphatase RsbU/P